MAAAKIKTGLQDKLYLGNLNAKRGWGRAKDYVRGMYLILQQNKPSEITAIRCLFRRKLKNKGV